MQNAAISLARLLNPEGLEPKTRLFLFDIYRKLQNEHKLQNRYENVNTNKKSGTSTPFLDVVQKTLRWAQIIIHACLKGVSS